MQPVNDDMDDLFRRAAQDYPLSTQGADFDALQQRMQASEKDDTPPEKEKGRRYSWLLLLLILLPFFFRHHYQHTATGNRQTTTQQTGTKSKAVAPHSPKQKGIAETGDSTLVNLTTVKSTPVQAPLATTTPTPEKRTSKQAPPVIHHPNNKVEDNEVRINDTLLSNLKISSKKTLPVANRLVLVSSNKKRNNKIVRESVNRLKDNGKQNTVTIKSGQKQSFKKDSIASVDERISDAKTDSAKVATQQKDTTATDVVKKPAAKSSIPQDTVAQKEPFKKADKPGSYLYAGVVIGPDYSTVKSTQTASTGFNVGMIAGYHFRKHWVVETGFLWNRKNYYADGKYVYADKLLLQMHTQVLHINGYCGMFEIPLDVQYHFGSKSNGHWYVTAGVSSYLMKKEEYYYLYRRYNMNYYGKKDYFNSTENWFSILQLGGGYQLKTGKRSSLRIAPYFKLPVSKIGIAKLPLSSTGLNIGYTVPL